MSRLHLRLVLVFAAVMLVASLLSAGLAYLLQPLPAVRLRAAVEGKAELLANDLAHGWPPAEGFDAWLARREAAHQLKLTLRDPRGVVLAGSPPHLPRGEDTAARGYGPRWRQTLRVELPVRRGDELLATLSAAPRLPAPDRPPPGRPRGFLALFLALGLGAAALLLWPLSRGLTRRLVALEAVANRLAQGDLGARAEARGRDEIDRLANCFNAMAAALEEQRQGRQRFFQAVSHELRSPLARLRVALDVLRESPNGEDRERFLNHAKRDIAEIDKLVGDLLEVARGREGGAPLRFETLDVRELARTLAEPCGVTLRLPQQPVIACADPEVLGRAIRNVLENAARYAGTEQPVELEARREGDMLALRFRDHGPGVPEHERERIFAPFYRPDEGRDRKSGGVGLGLALVRQAMEQHGGTALVEASSDGGAVFVLTLRDTSSAGGGRCDGG